MFSDTQKIRLLPRELRNLSQMWASRLFRHRYRRRVDSDIAYMYIEHPVILPLMLNIIRHLDTPIHLVKPEEDFSQYRKVIIPNGLWPSVKQATDSIDPGRRVFCEIGFFPQARNVYFDHQGVHGHSSIRHASLPKVTAGDSETLTQLRQHYRENNFVRVKWDSVAAGTSHADDLSLPQPYTLVPLQLERDTAFELCPFPDNQSIIANVEATLPDHHLVFKVHPQDNHPYTVGPNSTLLPNTNRQLTQLIDSARFVVGANSTVILEALLLGKTCATYGVGFSTGHDVTLECHDNLSRLSSIDTWQPDAQKIEAFLCLLLQRQVPIDFFNTPAGMQQARRVLGAQGVLAGSGEHSQPAPSAT